MTQIMRIAGGMGCGWIIAELYKHGQYGMAALLVISVILTIIGCLLND